MLPGHSHAIWRLTRWMPYRSRPANAYEPGPYYAAPGYAYCAPAYSHYAPARAHYAPPVYGYPDGRPDYGWRGGYVDAGAAARHRGVPEASPPARGMCALGAKRSPQIVKAPILSYIAPPRLGRPV